MNSDESKALLDKVLSYSRAENTECALGGYHQEATRFANNGITQNLARTDTTLSVRAAFGNKVGSASTNDLSDKGMREVAERAEAIARQAEPDTEYLPPLSQQRYAEVRAYFPATAACAPDQRAKAVKDAVGICAAERMTAAGSFTTEEGWTAVANSAGLFAHHLGSEARFIITAMTADSSGWAESVSTDVAKLRPEQAARTACAKAEAARNPREIEANPYTVVLEPVAAADFLSVLFYTLDAKAAHEGRSAFTGKEGQKAGDETVTLRSDPSHPMVPARPFFEDGMAAPAITWIDKGVVANLSYSRFWAKKCGREPTGWPSNVIMDPGTTSLDDMVASVDKGLLVTHFWYIRFVDPMTLLLTGMTRDGLYWIEGGKVAYGVKNLRFNESPLRMLSKIEVIGQAVPSADWGSRYVPALKVRDFTFTSGTLF